MGAASADLRVLWTYYPEENLTVVVLSNLETAVSGTIAADLAAIVLGEPYEVPQQPQAVTVDPTICEKDMRALTSFCRRGSLAGYTFTAIYSVSSYANLYDKAYPSSL